MKRKALAITLAAAMAMGTCAVTASAADGDKYTIGICQLVQHEALDAATQGFKDEVTKELGEDAVTFDEQNAQGDSNTCSTIINSFVSNNVDLILANATPALQAAAAGTSDIPILGTSVTEYGVALGLDDFDGTVGGNISGTADLAPLDQQAAMLNELFPDAKNVGLLYCSAEANSQYQVDTVKAELEKLGYTPEDDGSLLITRRISKDGRSSCRINGMPATVSVLHTLGKALVNIHGQHDSQSLLDPEQHYKFIDMLSGDSSVLSDYKAAFSRFLSVRRELKALTAAADSADKNLSLIHI